MNEAEPPGCVHHPISDLNCRLCALMRSEYYASLVNELDRAAYEALRSEHAWVRGQGKADRL